jgi:hypothetical protein
MNWGYKIMIFYLIFVAGIILLVYKSSTQNQDLVTPDYYKKELAFQQTIDSKERVNMLSSTPQISLDNKTISIKLPKEMSGVMVEAVVSLYCPSNKDNDFQTIVNTSKGLLEVPIANNCKGNFDLHLQWTAANKEYYYENKLFIQ